MLPHFVLALLLCHTTWSEEINPGLKIQFSQNGLKYVKEIAIANLKPMMSKIPIPDMHGTAEMAGEVKYDVTQIKITNFTVSNGDLTFSPGKGIQMSISNSQAVIENNWKIHSWAAKSSGSSIVTLNGISVSAIIVVSRNSIGAPSISLTDCISDVQDIEVELRGGISIFNNMIKDNMKRLCREKMNQQLCPTLIEKIEKWTRQLSEMNMQINLNANIGFDYSFVSEPVITKDDFTLPLKGRFYSRINTEETPFSAAPFSLPVLMDDMLCIGVSEFSFNSALYTYFKYNALTLNLDTLLPGGLDLANNTDLANAFPEAAKQKYPVTGILKAMKSPLVTLKPNNMTVEAALSVEVFAILPNSVHKSLATFNIDVSISAQLNIQCSNAALLLTGSVTTNRFQVQQADTKTKSKTSGVSKVEDSIKSMAEQGLLKIINERLRTGIPMPNLPYFPITNPSFKIEQTFVKICGNADLALPKQ